MGLCFYFIINGVVYGVNMHTKRLQVFHQLYCSTNNPQFQHNFLIIIANFIIRTLFAFTYPFQVTGSFARQKSALREPTFKLTQGAALLFFLSNNYKRTKILFYLKIYRKECSQDITLHHTSPKSTHARRCFQRCPAPDERPTPTACHIGQQRFCPRPWTKPARPRLSFQYKAHG